MKYEIGDRVKILGEQFTSMNSIGKNGIVIGTNKVNFTRPYKVYVYKENEIIDYLPWPVDKCDYYEYGADELELTFQYKRRLQMDVSGIAIVEPQSDE